MDRGTWLRKLVGFLVIFTAVLRYLLPRVGTWDPWLSPAQDSETICRVAVQLFQLQDPVMDASKQQQFDVEGGAPHGGIGTAPVKDFDDDGDLPITANRTAKWWYVAVHNITAMVGAGVLGLPYAMALLGELQVQQVALSPKLPPVGNCSTSVAQDDRLCRLSSFRQTVGE